ncbi:MAG: Rieske 2Fe-2S domain-containing protein [Deltaproteobacteria bacterium]|nr:Rieske 2Fe-2S domain-containing protein [Deltaproteobacteria bacterium]
MALRVRVCRLADVSIGELRAFTVPGVTWPVIVTYVDGALVAVPGVCPHEDVALADGDLDGSAIVCPGHGYRFDLHTGRCQHDAGLELRRYPITLVGDELWVDLL